MVRQSKQTPDQKKDSHKKKTQQQDKPSPKKPSDSTVWPCRINGCNKQFAREADLKRHQRTTKLHSVPGFACPQCDARFTRTDALRRHQKSRHNGVVIDSTDETDRHRSAGDEDFPSSGSRSKSRSRTPSSKENPNAVSPGGQQSYYRQHTFSGMMVPPPGVMGDGQYSSAVGLPTSSTRLHQASWQPAPPWAADGPQPPLPQVIHPGYAHPYYSAPPYYRPDTMMHSPDVAHSSSNGDSSSSRKGSPVLAVDPSLDHTRMEDPPGTGDAETTVIDPALVSPQGRNLDSKPSSTYHDHSSMPHVEVVSSTNGQVSRETRLSPSCAEYTSSSAAGESPNPGDGTDSETVIVQHLLSNTEHPFSPHSTSLEHSLDMEQILTEDGEPMLNPAELLTQVSTSNATSTVLDLIFQILEQESLASPPPS